MDWRKKQVWYVGQISLSHDPKSHLGQILVSWVNWGWCATINGTPMVAVMVTHTKKSSCRHCSKPCLHLHLLTLFIAHKYPETCSDTVQRVSKWFTLPIVLTHPTPCLSFVLPQSGRKPKMCLQQKGMQIFYSSFKFFRVIWQSFWRYQKTVSGKTCWEFS